MKLTHVVFGVAVIVMIALAGMHIHRNRIDSAGLDADLDRVRGIALEYARENCGTPPSNPVSLADALDDIGSSVIVRDPDAWSIAVTAQPAGGVYQGGVLVSLRYSAAAGSWQLTRLARRTGARSQEGAVMTIVEIPVRRYGAGGSRASFRFLWDDAACL